MTSVDIGQATADDESGIRSLSNNAAEFFPLGITTVIWTAIDGSGNSPVGFANGEAIVSLEDKDDGTMLTYEVEAENEEAAREIVKEEMKSFHPIFYRRKSKRKIILYHRSWDIENIKKYIP